MASLRVLARPQLPEDTITLGTVSSQCRSGGRGEQYITKHRSLKPHVGLLAENSVRGTPSFIKAVPTVGALGGNTGLALRQYGSSARLTTLDRRFPSPFLHLQDLKNASLLFT